MRRCLELMVLVATAGILVATSRGPVPCATELVNLRADTTCGPTANLAVTSNTSCTVTATGATFGGLPTSGSISAAFPDAGLFSGFMLTGTTDAGNTLRCDAQPSDGGFVIECTPSCLAVPDAGSLCVGACSGTLSPQ